MTEVMPEKREVALKILAKMIIRAYLCEIDRGEAGPNAYQDDLRVKHRAVKPSEKFSKAGQY